MQKEILPTYFSHWKNLWGLRSTRLRWRNGLNMTSKCDRIAAFRWQIQTWKCSSTCKLAVRDLKSNSMEYENDFNQTPKQTAADFIFELELKWNLLSYFCTKANPIIYSFELKSGKNVTKIIWESLHEIIGTQSTTHPFSGNEIFLTNVMPYKRS